MSSNRFSKVGGLSQDGRPVHMPAEAVDAMEWEERQLSSDLEKTLKISGEASFTNRGSEAPITIKNESRDSCMFNSSSAAPCYHTGPYQAPPDYNAWQASQLPTDYGESQWRQPSSMSSLSGFDLEMDREPSMTPVQPSFTQLAPQHVKQEQLQWHSCFGEQQQTQMIQNQNNIPGMQRFPNEDKLSQYGQQTATERDSKILQQTQWQQVDAGSHGNTETNTPVTMATEEEDLQHTFEVDENGEGPLHILSAVQDKTMMAKVLDMLEKCGVVSQCIDLQNKHKQTPLFLAVQAGNIPLTAWLLLKGADPNIQGTLYVDRDEYIWRAPLHLTAMKGDEALGLLRLLLTKSPRTDINILSHGDKLSPLHLALKNHTYIHSCRLTIMELIDRQADVRIREQNSSKTCLILAIETRDLTLIQEFLEKFSADARRTLLQEQTRAGDTCLHIAAGLSRFPSQQKEILLRLLVTNGANGNIANNVKELPRDFARAEWDRIRNY